MHRSLFALHLVRDMIPHLARMDDVLEVPNIVLGRLPEKSLETEEYSQLEWTVMKRSYQCWTGIVHLPPFQDALDIGGHEADVGDRIEGGDQS